MKSMTSPVMILLLVVTMVGTVSADWYWIQFRDKANNRHSLSNPRAFLSDASLDRRAKMGIALDEKDLPVSESYVNSVEALGYTVTNRVKWLNGVIIRPEGTINTDAIRALPCVTEVKTIYTETSERTRINKSVQNYVEPQAANQNFPNSRRNYGVGDVQIKQLNGAKLHDEGFDGKGVYVAVIDAGFENVDKNPYHKDLFDSNRLLDTYDFVSPNNPQIYSAASDHGAKVLSCIATDKDGDFIGTAPKAKFSLYRTEDGAKEGVFEEYLWVNAAERADSQGVEVINSSLGYYEFDNPAENHPWKDMDGQTTPAAKGANAAAERGILCVISAGNEGSKPWGKICTPSDADSAFCIGAIDGNGRVTSFSSRGFAPDGNIKPNVMARGGAAAVVNPNGSLGSANGTSFSAPVTAGMVACVKQAFPKLPVGVIFRNIEKSADRHSNPTEEYGYGIPDYYKAWELLNEVSVQKNGYVAHNRGIMLRNAHFTNTLSLTGNFNSSQVKASVVNMMGKVLYSVNVTPKANTVTLSGLNKLAKGTYVLSLNIGTEKIQKKIYSIN